MKLFKLFCILIFLIGSVIPLCYMSEEKISKWENRTLASFPKIIQSGKINNNYGSDFENWLSDRFWGRDQLIQLHLKAQFINRIVNNKNAFLLKNTGWMFREAQIPKDSMLPKGRKEIVDQMRNFFAFCEAHGIKLYVLVVPNKELIYSEKYDALGMPNRFQEYLNSLDNVMQAVGQKVIFPFSELRQLATEDFAFFKESHHWTDKSAYIGYKKLMEAIKKDFKDVKIVSLTNYKKRTNKKFEMTGHVILIRGTQPDYYI